MDIQYDLNFDVASSDRPYMMLPKVFSDNRGSFSEVLKGDVLSKVKQVNRSVSCQWTLRGSHAQKAPHCQAKLVEALTIPIYDIITDARPDSKTFGLTEVYLLDPKSQNKLFVPKGFLHTFAVPPNDDPNAQAMFMYYCDEVFSKEDEIGVCPMSIIPKVADMLKANANNENSILYSFTKMLECPEKLVLSEKDSKSTNYADFMEKVSEEYKKTKKLWYK